MTVKINVSLFDSTHVHLPNTIPGSQTPEIPQGLHPATYGMGLETNSTFHLLSHDTLSLLICVQKYG